MVPPAADGWSLQLGWRLWQMMPSSSFKTSFAWTCFCFLAHFVFAFTTVELLPRAKTLMSEYDRQEWYNRAVATLHATIMFMRVLTYWIADNPGWQMDKPLNAFGAMTMDIMMGYLWYDLIIELARSKRQSSTILHHVIGYVSLLAVRAAHSGLGIFYFMLVFLAEGSTPILHVLWFMKKLCLDSTPAFKGLALLLLFAFFVLRVVLGPVTLWHMIAYRGAWENDRDRHWLWQLLFGIAVVFVSINYYWFQLLVKMAMRQDKTKSKGEGKGEGEGEEKDKIKGQAAGAKSKAS